MRIVKIVKNLFKLNIWGFIYYNFISFSVKRDKKCYLFPYKHTQIELDKNAKITLKASLYLNANKLKGSRAECLMRMRSGSSLLVIGTATFYYGTTIEVFDDAQLILGKLTANTGVVIACAKRISIGQNVLLARNVFLYDSDHHNMVNTGGKIKNVAKEIIIGNNVWIGVKTTILKGVKIGDGAVINANSWVGKSVKSNTYSACLPARTILENINWSE